MHHISYALSSKILVFNYKESLINHMDSCLTTFLNYMLKHREMSAGSAP